MSSRTLYCLTSCDRIFQAFITTQELTIILGKRASLPARYQQKKKKKRPGSPSDSRPKALYSPQLPVHWTSKREAKFQKSPTSSWPLPSHLYVPSQSRFLNKLTFTGTTRSRPPNPPQRRQENNVRSPKRQGHR